MFKHKKLSCLIVLFFLGIVFLLANTSNAQATKFLASPTSAFLYLGRQLDVTYDNEDLKFVVTSSGTLQLMNRNGKNIYLTLKPLTSNGVGFAVRKIKIVDPNETFFEINADTGAHAKNCGYWIIGKRDGKWVTYISLNNLATMGYTINDWHQIRTEINKDDDGKFILISQHEYMPPGAIYGYQRKMAVDLKLELFWDKNARWFGMTNI